ncbi:MAG: thioredoxin family protein [Brumimicrobium sp.]|nr:thioredoxin family protein [Brumimicrobium sp.]
MEKEVSLENMTTWNGLLDRFDEIVSNPTPETPYDDQTYLEYTKLNRSRVKRWIKTAQINPKLIQVLNNIQEKQTWNLILEPWCGDAAHIAPFIHLMAEVNPNITLNIVWRDTAPFMIDDYLTNGGKSIPKLVIRDKEGKDLYVWGPRPKKCQDFFLGLKEKGMDHDQTKLELQEWYNKDKGVAIQEEFIQMLG